MTKKRTVKQIEDRIAELHRVSEERYLKRLNFIESIQGFAPVEKAGAWLNYVANDILDYGDQEALVYIASRGFDYNNIVRKLLDKWRGAEKRSVEMHFSHSSTVINIELISKIVSDKNNDTSQMNESEVILKKTIITNQNATVVLQPSKQALHFPSPAIAA